MGHPDDNVNLAERHFHGITGREFWEAEAMKHCWIVKQAQSGRFSAGPAPYFAGFASWPGTWGPRACWRRRQGQAVRMPHWEAYRVARAWGSGWRQYVVVVRLRGRG